jgi:putative endonuclease
MPWVYILECRDGSFYVGSTYDLERRLSEHNEGLGAAYTRRRRPVTLRWSGHYDRVEDAYAMEKKLQKWARSKRQALIDGDTDLLSTLASRAWQARRETGRA